MEFDTSVNIPFQDRNDISSVYTVTVEERERIVELWRELGVDNYELQDNITVNCYKAIQVREDRDREYYNIDHARVIEFPLNRVFFMFTN